MKCRKCSEKAVINMRQHKLSLCKADFLDWLPEQVQRTIQKYHMLSEQERILVAVSGGKDSLSLWDILWRLGYQADGLYIGLGINGSSGYSQESQHFAEKFAASRGLKLHIFDVTKHYGESIQAMASRTLRGREKPCAVCGMTKRHVMNRIAREEGYDVLATGHNLDDETAALFSNTLNWITGYLVRQYPVLEANRPGTVRKVKPLCRIYERDMTAYAILREIEYIYNECPYVVGSTTIYYKEVLNRMEFDRPGIKQNFYLSFLKAKEEGLFSPKADPDIEKLHPCPSCGQPTPLPGECSFCRLIHHPSKN